MPGDGGTARATHGERRSRYLAGLVFLVLWGLITHGTYAGTGDEPHYQIITHSLVFDRDLDVTTDYSNPQNRSLGGHFEGGAHIRPGADGRLRPVHDVGMPMLFAPYYLISYRITEQLVAHVPAAWLTRARLNFTVLLRHLLSFAMIALTAWMAVNLLAIFTTLSSEANRAFAWVLLLVLSPPIMSHSFLFFTEILSASIGLGVFIWLRAAARTTTRNASTRGRLEAVAVGAVTGYLLLIHARNAGLIGGLCLLAARQSRSWPDKKTLVFFAAGASLSFALRTVVTYHLWGTWLTTPHARFGGVIGWQTFVIESLTRIAGWSFDQEEGLLPYAPIYLLAPAGWLVLWRRQRDLCIAVTIVVVSYMAVVTLPVLNVHGWRGGWTPAARYLVPIAPFLAILVFGAVAYAPRIPAMVLSIVGVQIVLDAVLWQRPGLFWNNGIGTSALLQFLDGETGWLTASVPSVMVLDARTIAMVAAFATAWLLLTLRRASKDAW